MNLNWQTIWALFPVNVLSQTDPEPEAVFSSHSWKATVSVSSNSNKPHLNDMSLAQSIKIFFIMVPWLLH